MEIINFDNLKYFFILVLYVLAIIGPLLIAVAFLTYLERKSNCFSSIQKRTKCCRLFWITSAFC